MSDDDDDNDDHFDRAYDDRLWATKKDKYLQGAYNVGRRRSFREGAAWGTAFGIVIGLAGAIYWYRMITDGRLAAFLLLELFVAGIALAIVGHFISQTKKPVVRTLFSYEEDE